jgi:hypothetical protein
MKIVGCDYHPSFQHMAISDISAGLVRELKLVHAAGEAGQFYRELEAPVLIGMESVGDAGRGSGYALPFWVPEACLEPQRRLIPRFGRGSLPSTLACLTQSRGWN